MYEKYTAEQLAAKYAEVTVDLHATLTLLVDDGHITRREAQRVRARQWTTPAIYFLPKIHKDKREYTGGFAARSIIGAFSNLLKPLDDYITNLSSPILQLIPGSLRDTTQLLTELDNLPTLPGGASLFSADLEALYPSIPWDEGIEAATALYYQHWPDLEKLHPELLPPPSPAVFNTLLKLILTNKSK